MKTAIIYYSKHHGNTEKLVDAIAEKHDIALIEADKCPKANLADYDLIGFASGIYCHRFHDSVLEFAMENLPEGKKVFLLCTYGVKCSTYTDGIRSILKESNAKLLGTFGCPGSFTAGPLKLIGGIPKGRPNSRDFDRANRFFEKICQISEAK